MIKRIISVILITIFVNAIPAFSKNTNSSFKSVTVGGVIVKVITTKPSNIKESNTLKGYTSGINASYFNVNTRKTIKYGDYRRPFIVFKKDKTILITDDKKDVLEGDSPVSAGSWLVKDSVQYSTQDKFSKQFKNARVPRTCFGMDKEGNVLLVTISNANLTKASSIMKKLGCIRSINMDGGSSSTLKYESKMRFGGGRRVANYIVGIS